MVLFRQLFLWVKLSIIKLHQEEELSNLHTAGMKYTRMSLTSVSSGKHKIHLRLTKSKIPKMLRRQSKTGYLQHHKSWGPRGRAYRLSSLLLLPSSSDQGIYLDGEDYSRQTLHTPSENKERKLRLADEALRTPHVHCRSKLAAFYHKNTTELNCSCR